MTSSSAPQQQQGALVCDGCGKTGATMRCPKCSSMHLRDSYFCSQACFAASWPVHKQKHAIFDILTSSLLTSTSHTAPDTDHRFSGFRFTGPLRPGVVSPLRSVPNSVRPRPDYADDAEGRPLSEIAWAQSGHSNSVVSKTSEEVQGMREACRVAREVLDEGARAVRPGATTDEIDRVVHEACVAREAYPSPLGYRGFPKSVCTSVNEVVCHGIPDSRELCEGDVVNLDVTTFFRGFHGDLNETYAVGRVDDESKKLVRVTYESMMAAIDACRPGMLYRQVGDVISRHVARASDGKFSVVKSFVGHGIGRLFHTSPNVPHFAKNHAIGVMQPGHTFTIEPMINAGTVGTAVWPDGWTAVTQDGKRSAQFEHTVLITEGGHEILTARTESSPALWFL